MEISVVVEHRFQKTPDGKVWTTTQFAYEYWTRYLTVYRSVNVVARVQDVASIGSENTRADGDRVKFTRLPYYQGPREAIFKLWRLRAALMAIWESSDAMILRIPSPLTLLLPVASYSRKRFAVEVVGDPAQVFTVKVFKNPVILIFRELMVRLQKLQCARAVAASYVTRRYLQNIYPASEEIWATDVNLDIRPRVFGISSIALEREEMSGVRVLKQNIPYTIITVGSLEQNYKGVDLLIQAVHYLRVRGMELRLLVVGDGKLRKQLEKCAAHCGVDDVTTFLGQVSAGKKINDLLDSADLFVLASRTEGLPRAILEAMARGLPCVATKVGGIPELLPQEVLVQPEDQAALAEKIHFVLSNADVYHRLSQHGIDSSMEFLPAALQARREDFYRCLIDHVDR